MEGVSLFACLPAFWVPSAWGWRRRLWFSNFRINIYLIPTFLYNPELQLRLFLPSSTSPQVPSNFTLSREKTCSALLGKGRGSSLADELEKRSGDLSVLSRFTANRPTLNFQEGLQLAVPNVLAIVWHKLDCFFLFPYLQFMIQFFLGG